MATTTGRGLYTYAVRARGVVAIVDGPEGRELRFPGTISRGDGWSRPQEVVVRPVHSRPDLLDAVADAVRGGREARMTVRFERITGERDGVAFLRVRAVVDALLDGHRAADPRQMDLFA